VRVSGGVCVCVCVCVIMNGVRPNTRCEVCATMICAVRLEMSGRVLQRSCYEFLDISHDEGAWVVEPLGSSKMECAG